MKLQISYHKCGCALISKMKRIRNWEESLSRVVAPHSQEIETYLPWFRSLPAWRTLPNSQSSENYRSGILSYHPTWTSLWQIGDVTIHPPSLMDRGPRGLHSNPVKRNLYHFFFMKINRLVTAIRCLISRNMDTLVGFMPHIAPLAEIKIWWWQGCPVYDRMIIKDGYSVYIDFLVQPLVDNQLMRGCLICKVLHQSACAYVILISWAQLG